MLVSTRFKPTRKTYEDPRTTWRRETAPEVLQGKSRIVAAQIKNTHEPIRRSNPREATLPEAACGPCSEGRGRKPKTHAGSLAPFVKSDDLEAPAAGTPDPKPTL